MKFFRPESEKKEATTFYAAHIFDYRSHWGTDVLFSSRAQIARCDKMVDLHEYHSTNASGAKSAPVYSHECVGFQGVPCHPSARAEAYTL